MYSIGKINNSYCICVPTKCKEYYPISTRVKTPEWKKGSVVKHYFYGEGIIKKIHNNRMYVNFNKKRIGTMRNFIVEFKFKTSPGDIEDLKLCS
jgi:hypothetical protein